ncbi:DUF4296 domain-containing protein [uncultured Lacinutrix sp.]|uniref:DUF4296 domain-containing protein n=1 Tax=uncultured Lacinutrix sp. TaxID=574032 RepID=UPI00261F7274|nr:DUF4296 domain-containing protein [uncultured Lacinutrix sp.]
MKFYYGILLILGMLFTSCYNVEKPEKPKDLLSQDEMVAILVDMAIISSAKGTNKKKIENIGIAPNEYIFKRHNIDSIRFNNSNNFYAYNIDKYTEIYKQVEDSLTVLRDVYKEIEAKEKKEKTIRDSINKIRTIKQDSIYKANGGKAKLKKIQSQKQKGIGELKKQIKEKK